MRCWLYYIISHCISQKMTKLSLLSLNVFYNCHVLIFVFDLFYLSDSRWNVSPHQSGTKHYTGTYVRTCLRFTRYYKLFKFSHQEKCGDFCTFLSHLHSFINMFDYLSNYRAWSQIVYSLIPNVELLETQLDDFSTICAADEVVLFERATFLVISHISKLK